MLLPIVLPFLTLHYFDILGGAGEPIRNAFKISGVSFDDVRVPINDWPEVKNHPTRFSFGQMPVLEVDGVPYSQSVAILRYVGKLSGLYPADPLEALKVDEIIDCFVEMRGKMSVARMVPEDVKPSVLENVGEFMKLYYAKINNRIAENGTGFAAGDKLTIADLVVHNDATSPHYGAEVVDMSQYPAILRVISNVEAALQ